MVGRSGGGKTTFFYNILDTLHDKDIPFLVFDFKNDYRHVVDDFDLVVLNWQDLKFNPLQPLPGVRPERWAEALVDVWAHAMGVFVPSKGYFLRKLRQLYQLYEDEIEEGLYPSLFELRDLVQADAIHPSSPRFSYMERLENRTTMMTGFSGDSFDCARSHPTEDLLDQKALSS